MILAIVERLCLQLNGRAFAGPEATGLLNAVVKPDVHRRPLYFEWVAVLIRVNFPSPPFRPSKDGHWHLFESNAPSAKRAPPVEQIWQKKAPENRGQFRKEEETEGPTLLPVFCSRRPCHDRCSWTTSNETGRVNSFRSSLTPLWNKRNSRLATICVSTLSGWGLFSSVQRTSITRLNY